MLLFELFDKSVDGIQDVSSDQSKIEWEDTRKAKLTLKHLSKLRQLHDTRTFEKHENLKKVRNQYKAPAQNPAGF
jgi:hypothetical protein